ncbi:PucR family transcriptional regulator [Aerococcus sp. L_32]|uniref:PucR family transcriptional regulator n=1 Tax=Aerococcus sp. L_32 TaxID=3422316 RepID=UPI0033616150
MERNEEYIMISLANLLDSPRFSDIKLLTDRNQTPLDQEIKSVDISDTPDIEHYIPEGVFLLTTAMIYKEDQSGLIPLIDSLIRASAVGLGIKLGRFLNGHLDPKIIQYANKVNFPIFAIPDDYSLGELLHQLMSNIWGTKYEEVSFALDIQSQFSNLLIQNASNEVIINELAKTIKTPTILLSPYREIISHSRHFNNSSNSAQLYVDQIIQLMDNETKNKGSFIVENAKGQQFQVSVTPIKVYNYFPHYLVILKPEQIPYPISSFAIDQAATVLSFILFKNEKVAESRFTIETDYFKEMVDNNYKVDSSLAPQEPNMKHGYILSNFYQVAHVFEKTAINQSKLTHLQEELLQLTFKWIKKKISHYFANALVIQFQNTKEIVVLFQQQDPHLSAKLGKMAADIQDKLPLHLIFSLGNPYYNWEQISQSYTEAKLVFDERRQSEHGELIMHYEDKGMLQLFNNLDKNDVTFFCQNILKAFAFPEDPTLIDLRKTLTVYLDSQCEIASTASKLFVHRNTVKYRIQRCEEILGHDVSSPENSLNLRLALNLIDEIK